MSAASICQRGFTYKNYLENDYKEQEWMGRKCTAIPMALYTATIESIKFVALSLFKGIPKVLTGNNQLIKQYALQYGRELQRVVGYIITLFHDKIGCYLTFDHPVVQKTNFPDLNLINRGKVRDVYDLGDQLLFVATDRISAFDCILPSGIPEKGKTLNQLSLFWFEYLKDIVPNHFISANVDDYPKVAQKYRDQLEGRSMLVKKAHVIKIECIVRGYITGSGWKDYEKTGQVCGIQLKKGLQKSQKLDEPIFTPSTKADVGHDENITYEQAETIVGETTARLVREKSLALYKKAAEYALEKGVILCDTKFEFGIDIATGKLMLIDEVLTPDSSRYWDANDHQVGVENKSFDKQFVRNYLETTGWNKKPPAPSLPEEIVHKTREKYVAIQKQLIAS